MTANTWEIAWNGFAKEWEEKRSGHGALFRCILQAGQAMKNKGLIVILPPRDQHDTYTFSSLAKWKDAEQKIHPTPPASRTGIALGMADVALKKQRARKSAGG